MSLSLHSKILNDRTLRVNWEGHHLFDYQYRPDIIEHYFARPFMHPIRTLAGDLLTNACPVDHPWHNGLSMTLNNVNGMNFWGGGTYRKETGQYEDLPKAAPYLLVVQAGRCTHRL